MTIGISIYIVQFIGSDRDQLIEEQAKTLAEAVAYTSEFNLINLNKQALQSRLREITATSSLPIENLIIFDDTGELFAASNYKNVNYEYNLDFEPNSQHIVIHHDKEDSTLLITDILGLDNHFNPISQWQSEQTDSPSLGHVLLVLDMSKEAYQRFLTNLNLFVLIGISALLTALLMGALLHRVISPLHAFVAAVKRIGSGDLKFRLNTPVQFEFKDLRDGINVMAEQLYHHQSKLESEIEDATKDIQQNLLLVEEKNAELDIARKEALEASKIKSQFLATMSHEVRTPLNAIVGFTKELEKANLPEPYTDYVETINASADNLIAIVNDVLDFSKIEAGKIELEYSAFNLTQTVEDVTKLMSRDAFAKGLEFCIESDVLPIAAIGDQHRFKQILNNLLSNAIKFTPKGFVILRINIESISETQHKLKLEIQDSGIGISKEKQAKLFSAFHQADATTTRKYGGTGLGLAITHGLVKKMGGRLEIDSALGRGSVFSLEIPLTTSKPTLIEKPVRLNKALVLDPHPITHNSYKILFQQLGIVADIFEETEDWEAQLHQQNNYDLIIIASDSDEESLELLPLQASFAEKQQEHALVLLSVPLYSSLPEQHKKLLGQQPVVEKPFSFCKLDQAWEKYNSMQWLANEASVPDISQQSDNQPSIKMLAVDDNETNLKLLGAILRNGRVDLTISNSGKEACKIAEEQVFDLILMDVQMPEMDGIQTTSFIRQGNLNKHTPIIAFTAHAFKEEREKLLRSGMDDYLSKPIDMIKFNQLVNKWVLGGAAKSTHSEKSSAMPNSMQSGIDWQLSMEKANNKHDIAVEMLTMLVDSFDTVKQDIQYALRKGDDKYLLDVIHKFHGSTCYSGVPYLRYLANNIESQLKKDVRVNIEELLEKLCDEMTVVTNGMADIEQK
ncbi:hypothetical protein XM47_07300 [Catenovulum maritimum]|uniref:histidine kinase n=2 Tax=Catenovulum maritimum TaxID=1513271 RepID=A0A0J8GX57_9ALTE|nr:hypothetical protein XM47_07300 [Catenovulum maritimum]